MAPVFRIQLILPSDGSEGNRKIWFFIEPSIKTISELIKSIQSKVPVPRACTLYLEDAILPEYESIQILRDGEAVRVTCEEEATAAIENAAVKKKKKRKEREVAEPEAPNTTVETPEKKKRKISKNHEEPAVARTQSKIDEPVLPAAAENKTSETEITVEDATVDDDIKHKRRRRRHRRRKTNEAEDVPVPSEVINVLPTPTLAVRHINKANHIRFAEEESKTVEEISEAEQMRVNTTSNNTNLLASLTSLKSAMFVRSPSVTSSPQQVTANSKKPDGDSFIFRPENYSILASQPRPGDVIAFKVLELGENYTPRVSDYYQAQVISVSPFGDISLSLRNKPSGNLNKNGKFELVWDEEGDSEPSNSDVTYQWSELIEPRLLSC